MMPNPTDRRDERGQAIPPQQPYDRIGNLPPPRTYVSVKNTLETCYADTMMGEHLSAKKRVEQGIAYANQGIELLDWKYPDSEPKNVAVQEKIVRAYTELHDIPIPHVTYTSSNSLGRNVLQARGIAPDAPSESLSETVAPLVLQEMIERDFEIILPRVLRVVAIITPLLMDAGILKFDLDEESVVDDLDDEFFDGEEDKRR